MIATEMVDSTTNKQQINTAILYKRVTYLTRNNIKCKIRNLKESRNGITVLSISNGETYKL